MKIFLLKELDDYINFVEHIVQLDQPVFLYQSDYAENYILVSDKELDDVETKINELIDQAELDKKNNKIVEKNLEDEPLYDDTDEIDDWLLFF